MHNSFKRDHGMDKTSCLKSDKYENSFRLTNQLKNVFLKSFCHNKIPYIYWIIFGCIKSLSLDPVGDRSSKEDVKWHCPADRVKAIFH